MKSKKFIFKWLSLCLAIYAVILMASCEDMEEAQKKKNERNKAVREYVEYHELWNKTDSISSDITYFVHYVNKHKIIVYKFDEKYRGNIVPVHMRELCPECLKDTVKGNK